MELEKKPNTPIQTKGSIPGITYGKRFGHLIRLKPEYEERYIVLHAHPFPGLIDQLRTSGLCNYSIFHHDNLLFSFYEYVGDNYEADMVAISENDTVQDWWTLTDSMQETLAPEDSDLWWMPMNEIWHGVDKTTPSSLTQQVTRISFLENGSGEAVRAVYSEAASELKAALRMTNIQNFNVFYWKSYLCQYFEYAGKQFKADIGRLRESSVIQTVREALNALTRQGASAHSRQLITEPVFYMS